jgi:hypothetical protein
MRLFRRFSDDRFAPTTLQNPTIEARTYAELVQAARQKRENRPARHFTPTDVLDAVPALAHSNKEGRRIHPSTKSEVMFSLQRLPAGQAGQPILIASRPLIENDAND